MKRVSLLLALLLVASMSTTAFAEEPALTTPTTPTDTPEPTVTILQETGEPEAATLKDVRMVSENGQNLLIKTWETAPDYDPDKLVEADFQKNGRHSKRTVNSGADMGWDTYHLCQHRIYRKPHFQDLF